MIPFNAIVKGLMSLQEPAIFDLKNYSRNRAKVKAIIKVKNFSTSSDEIEAKDNKQKPIMLFLFRHYAVPPIGKENDVENQIVISSRVRG